jgi:hypothetical protein
MDDMVVRAMRKWPAVPEVFGWLRLDRRGRWLVKSAEGGFERIGHPAVVDFIQRNYEPDTRGRWFFQNGPQRVYVALDYTPWIYRLGDRGEDLVTHTGRASGPLKALLADEAGALLVLAEAGIGVMDDRDVPALLNIMAREDPGDGSLDALLEGSATTAQLSLLGQRVPVRTVKSENVACRFGFVPEPSPPPGQAAC